ncbi:hypothetical protein L208DRAFT_1332530, partial [Tricholoma matsutake]
GDDDAGMESDTEVKEASLCRDLEDEGLQESMFKLALDEGDDMLDEDWLPYQLRKTKKLKTEQPKQYVKGPDIMTKSKCMQHCYRKASHNQKTLDSFIFSTHKVVHAPRLPQSSAGHDVINSEAVTIRQESVEVEIPPTIHEESIEAQIQPVICEESVNPAVIHEETVDIEIPPTIRAESVEAVTPAEEDEMGWEDDLNECVQGGGVEICGWDGL